MSVDIHRVCAMKKWLSDQKQRNVYFSVRNHEVRNALTLGCKHVQFCPLDSPLKYNKFSTLEVIAGATLFPSPRPVYKKAKGDKMAKNCNKTAVCN